jgi:hypothetical protein
MVENILPGLAFMVQCLVIQALLVSVLVRFHARHHDALLAGVSTAVVMAAVQDA